MEAILDFAKDNYILLIIICCVLILALVGYFGEKKLKSDIVIKPKPNDSSNAPEELLTVDEPAGGLNMSVDNK